MASQATILTRSTCKTNTAVLQTGGGAPTYLGEVRVLTEFHLLQHEGPDVVTKAVRVEFIGLSEMIRSTTSIVK